MRCSLRETKLQVLVDGESTRGLILADLEKMALAGAPQQWDKLRKTHSSPKTQERQSWVNHTAHVAGRYLQKRLGLGTALAAWRGGKGKNGREGARRRLTQGPLGCSGGSPHLSQGRAEATSKHKAAAPRLPVPSSPQHRWPWRWGGLGARTPGSEGPPARAGRQRRAPGCHWDEKQQETARWEEGRRKEEKAFQAFVNHRADRGPSRREGKIPSQR